MNTRKMKTKPSRSSVPASVFQGALSVLMALLFCSLAGCSRREPAPAGSLPPRDNTAAIILAPHDGAGRIDAEIRRVQDQVRAGRDTDRALERLGWLFVKKARESFDPGFYRLAEQCALSLGSRQPRSPEAMLLRGHVLHNLHRFKEAEPLAHELVAGRGLPFDFGLLADVLMEQGKLEEAIPACQKMIDMRPDLHSYSRGAHLRWLKGDLAGAEELMRLAAGAASPHDPESAAWAHTRLALYEFQSGTPAEAGQDCAVALDFQKDYPPALLLRGRLALARGENAEAIELLRRATELNPLPEYQWTLADALEAAGQTEAAAATEVVLRRKGATTDPRTYSLYLATRGQEPEIAVRLAHAELNARQDIFTHDAAAWAFAAAGRLPEARQELDLALAQGTRDARLFFHAAAIAWKSGDPELAGRRMNEAAALSAMLLPSERQLLHRLAAEIAASRKETEPIPTDPVLSGARWTARPTQARLAISDSPSD
jgi:tetratricopeptide (TPR) repeat protein